MAEESARHKVVVVGGGFGGLPAIRLLGRKPVDVTVVDRRNHHLFQPLLYQVATGMLSPWQIAPPIRHVVRRHENVRVELAEVTGFDLDRRIVHATAAAHLHDIEIPYDSLIVAAGVNQSHFGTRRAGPIRAGHEDDRRRPRAAPADLRCLRDGRGRRRRRGLGEYRTFDPASVRALLLDGSRSRSPRSATGSPGRPRRSWSVSESSCGWAPGWWGGRVWRRRRRCRRQQVQDRGPHDGLGGGRAGISTGRQARRSGGGVVEGYPQDTNGKRVSASFLYNGTRNLFEQAVFAFERPKGKNHCVMTTTVAPPARRRS